MEDVVPQDQRDGIVTDEVAADDEGIGQSPRVLLDGIRKPQADFGAVSEEALEQRPILRG